MTPVMKLILIINLHARPIRRDSALLKMAELGAKRVQNNIVEGWYF